MTYQEILNHIYGLGRFGIKPGLSRITALLQALDNPQSALKVIHVAGTNGKGSTSCFISSILAAGGYRVGLFTSPHLIGFTERIRINGTDITEEDVVRLGQRVLAAAPPGTTFFEIVTAMACMHFAERHVDVAVMEAGMGGSFDATNALSGILSVITPISLDHSEYLGSSVAAIAREKAGIVKPGKPVVVSRQAQEALAEIGIRCREQNSPLYCWERDFSADGAQGRIDYHGLSAALVDVRLGLLGRYQTENAAAALAAAELLDTDGFPLTPKALRAGVEKANWPGRMELIGSSPRVLLEGAHNPAGSIALAEALADFSFQRLFLVVGIMGDKDLEGIVGPILPLTYQAVAVAPALPRALPSAELAAFCRQQGVTVHDGGGVAAGLKLACTMAGAEDLVLVCGSLFTVGEARAEILSRPFEPFRG